MSFFDELKRRNVIRIAIAYVVVAWLLIQVAETIFPLFGFGDAPARAIVIVMAIGFVPALVLAWVFEITPQGLKRDVDVDHNLSIARGTGKRFDRIILVALAVAVAYFAFDKFVLDPERDQANLVVARKEARSHALVESYGDRSIAVLPFVDMSPEKDQEYMSDGIAEELLNLLARVPKLRVISRSSAFAFKGKDIDIPTVAKKLNVAYVLEGSVRKAGQQLRITAQLIEAGTDTHLWSETYDRRLENVFDIQDEISASIIESLKLELLPADYPEGSENITNSDAYNAYLIGLERMGLRTQADLEAGRTQFEKAIEIDQDFAAAHVQLAHTLLLLEIRLYGGMGVESDEADAIIAEHLDIAQRLAPKLPEMFGVRGYHHYRRERDTEALEFFDRAIALNPNYALAYNWRADLARYDDRFLDMLEDREKAYSLDPMSLQISVDLAGEYRNFWRPDDAERVINRMFDLLPDHPLVYRAAALNMGMHGRAADAQLINDKGVIAHPDNAFLKRTQPIGLYYMGFFNELEALDSDHLMFSAYLIQGHFEKAKAFVDNIKKEGDRASLAYERTYYRTVGGVDDIASLAEAVGRSIEYRETNSKAWKRRCDTKMIYDMRVTQHKDTDAIISMLAECDRILEKRLIAGYICPCDLERLVMYTILDQRFDDAIERADQWMDSGYSTPDLPSNPIFKLLSERAEYQGLLDRNAEQILRQRQMYLAAKGSAT